MKTALMVAAGAVVVCGIYILWPNSVIAVAHEVRKEEKIAARRDKREDPVVVVAQPEESGNMMQASRAVEEGRQSRIANE